MYTLKYKESLKPFAQKLRAGMTLQERMLWKFLRQKPIGAYIVDFYAPEVISH